MSKTKIISTSFSGYGHKKITIEYHGKLYSAVTNNMPLYDDYNRECFSKKDEVIQRRATKSLIHFVKEKNNLK